MEKIEVINYVNELIKKHLSNKWTFKFNKRKRSLGSCSYNTNTKQGIISLSIYTLDTNTETIQDTILHELAHAIEYQENGTSSHGKNWQRIAQELGAEPERLANRESSQLFKQNITYKYTGTCSDCGKVFNRHRTSGGKYSHKGCNGSIEFKSNY